MDDMTGDIFPIRCAAVASRLRWADGMHHTRPIVRASTHEDSEERLCHEVLATTYISTVRKRMYPLCVPAPAKTLLAVSLPCQI